MADHQPHCGGSGHCRSVLLIRMDRNAMFHRSLISLNKDGGRCLRPAGVPALTTERDSQRVVRDLRRLDSK